MRQYTIVSRVPVRSRPAAMYSRRSSSSDLNVPSSLAARDHGTLTAVGTWPGPCGCSCGKLAGARRRPANASAEAHRTADVVDLIGIGVFVDFHGDHVRVIQAALEPVGVDEYIVACHGQSSFSGEVDGANPIDDVRLYTNPLCINNASIEDW